MTLRKLLLVALVLSPSLARPAGPPKAPTSPRVAISATPPLLELAPGARAKLRITAPDQPLVSASVGEIQELRAVGKGIFEAIYVPPSQTYPQVAIIVAASLHAHGWLALPLAGTGEVSALADSSGTATVTIGKRRFGPQRAGADHRARIRIVVPPGIRHAMAGGKRMNLNTPDVSHVYVTVSGSAVKSDESATILVRAYAVTPEGKPRRNAPLELRAAPGRLSAAREVEPGVFEARWSLSPGDTGAATVEARLGDETASVSRAAVQRESAATRRIRLDVDRPSAVAGEGVLDFTVVLEDGAGNPVDDLSPRVTNSVGTFLGWTRGMPGRWTGHLAIPERLEGASKLVIVVTAGELMARREVTLQPGPIADISVEHEGWVGRGSPLTLSVAVVDRFGNPTDEATPVAKATLGALEAPARQSTGLYRMTYHPPATATASRDEITVRAGRSERITRLPLYESSGSRVSAGLKGGGAIGAGQFSPTVGLEAAYWTSLGGRRFGLVMDGSWFHFSQGHTVSGTNVANDATYLTLTLAPAWRQPLGRRVVLTASAGGGLVRVLNTSQLAGQPEVKQSGWAPAGTAALSLGMKALGGHPFLELRGSLVADPGLKSLTGSFTPISFQLGYRFDAF